MLRRDPITGTDRLVAPGRADRLGPRPKGCPFCAGNEHLTPETTGERPRRDSTPTAATWSARSFPNLFPLTDPHEVIVASPRHCTSWRDLELPELQDGLGLLIERRQSLATATGDAQYVHAFVNDGPAAGASLPHVHGQVVVVDRGPHTDRLVANVRDTDTCALCHLLAPDSDLVVERGRHHAIVAHPTPRLGGGLLIVPLAHDARDPAAHLTELAELVHRAWQAIDPGADANLWLVADDDAHWYVELQPRTANLAGVELALGLNVSAADPLVTAENTRTRLGMPASH